MNKRILLRFATKVLFREREGVMASAMTIKVFGFYPSHRYSKKELNKLKFSKYSRTHLHELKTQGNLPSPNQET